MANKIADLLRIIEFLLKSSTVHGKKALLVRMHIWCVGIRARQIFKRIWVVIRLATTVIVYSHEPIS
jgi:hypothetical protein